MADANESLLTTIGLLRGPFEASVEGALRAKVITRCLSAPLAWSEQRLPSREDRLHSVSWAVLQRGDFHAHMCRLLRSEFKMYSRDGILVSVCEHITAASVSNKPASTDSVLEVKSQVLDLARAAFYRLATRGQTSGPSTAEPRTPPSAAAFNSALSASVASHQRVLHTQSGPQAWGAPHPLGVNRKGQEAVCDDPLSPPLHGPHPTDSRSPAHGVRLSTASPFLGGVGSMTGAAAGALALSLEDFLVAFGCGAGSSPQTEGDALLLRSLATQAFSTADEDCDGRVTEAGFIAMILALHESWRNTRRTLLGHGSSQVLLERILGAAFWTVAVCASLAVFGVSLAETMMPLATVAIAASFALGRAASDTVVGLIFTLVMHPFDVGDLVTIAPATQSPPTSQADSILYMPGALRVVSVDVLTTCFEQQDGRMTVWPNAALYGMTLTNLRRSSPPAVTLHLSVNKPPHAASDGVSPSDDAPVASLPVVINQLKDAMARYAASKPAIWGPVVNMMWAGGGDVRGTECNCADVVLSMALMLPWQALSRITAARSLLVQQLITEMRKLGLHGVVDLQR